MDATITVSGTIVALWLMVWYIGYRGEIHGRVRMTIFALSAASLPFLSSIATRFWQLLDSAAATATHVQQTHSLGAGLILGVLSWR